MIEVPCPVEFFRLLPSQEQTGTHCIGNHIYLSVEQIDRLLEINPDAARFVIAHELIHALRFHTLKNSAWGFVLHFRPRGLLWVAQQREVADKDSTSC